MGLLHDLIWGKAVNGGEGGGGSGDFSTAEVTVKYYETDINYGGTFVTVHNNIAKGSNVGLKRLGEDYTNNCLINSQIFFTDAIVDFTVEGDLEKVAGPLNSHFVIVRGAGVVTITSVIPVE